MTNLHMPKLNYKKTKSKKSFILYTLHLPILVVFAGVLALTTFFSSTVTEFATKMKTENNKLGFVLGDDDDDRDDDEDEDKDDDRDDDKDDDRDDDKDDDRDDDEDDDRDDDKAFYNFNSDAKPYEDDDDERDEEKEIEERVQNADGTFSIIKRKIEDDGKFKYEIKTYDANGNKISVEKYESDDDDEKSMVKIYDEFGNKLSDFRLRTDDGKRLELRLKEGETELSRVRFDVDKQELLVRTDNDEEIEEENEMENDSSDNKLRIRLLGDNFILTRQGVDAISKFPLTINDEDGTILIQTPSGEIKLGVMPDTLVENAKNSEDVDDIDSLEIEPDDDDEDELYMKLMGTKSERLLGLFKIEIPTVLIYDVETGDFLREEPGTLITRILALFSF